MKSQTKISRAFLIKLSSFLIDKKMTKKEMAHSVDVTGATISGWWNGRMPQLAVAKRLVKFIKENKGDLTLKDCGYYEKTYISKLANEE